MFKLPADKNEIKPNVFHKQCPARFLLDKISDKWCILLIDVLSDKTMRNGELIRAVDGISQKMLTQTLRKLEEMKLLSRTDMQTVPPHVEYKLTELGIALHERICAMDRWIEDNMLNLIPEDQISYK